MLILKAYIENAGSDVLADWYATHPGNRWTKLWARYYTIWFHLRQQPVSGWTGPYFHFLTGKGGIGRIGFDFNKIAYRHLGFFGPGAQDFTILYTAEEHDDVYLPKGCIDKAVERMKSVKANPSLVRVATIQVPPK